MLRTGWKHVFFKPTVSTHAHHSNYTLSQSTQHWEWDCNYASIMLMKSWWILIILTVVLCFLVCFSVSLKNLKPFMCFRDFFFLFRSTQVFVNIQLTDTASHINTNTEHRSSHNHSYSSHSLLFVFTFGPAGIQKTWSSLLSLRYVFPVHLIWHV